MRRYPLPISLLCATALQFGAVPCALAENLDRLLSDVKPEDAKVELAQPHPWTWQHWWEANRDPYLYDIAHRIHAKPPGEAMRPAVREILLNALKGSEPVRAAGALALARIGAADTFQQLKTLAENDESLTVRDHALLAIGLLDTDQANDYLTRMRLPAVNRDFYRRDVRIRHQVQHAVGAKVNAVNEFEVQWVAEAVRASKSVLTPRPGQQRIVHFDSRPDFWAAWDEMQLRHDRRPDDHYVKTSLLAALVYDVVNRRTPTGDPRDNVFRRQELLNGGRNSLRSGPSDVRLAKKPGAINPNIILAPVAFAGGDIDVVAPRHLGDVYIARIRASAAMMAGETGDPLLRKAMLAMLDQSHNTYHRLPQGFAIMALAKRPDTDMLPVMLNLVATGDSTREIYYRSEPLRGYAALALGFYARNDVNRPGYEQALTLLAERLADTREDEDVRCACAVAIGLSGRDGMLTPLKEISLDTSRFRHRINAYLILARGMLGDETIVEPAFKLLGATQSTALDATDARRAAIMGLGMIGSEAANKALAASWPSDYFARHEIIYALTLSNPGLACELLLTKLAEADREHEQAQLVSLFGQLFDYYEPSRIHRLTNNVNYTQWDARIRFQRLANPWLYDQLIPSMNSRWW